MYKDVISIFGGSSFIAQELIAILIPQGFSVNLFSNNVLKSKDNLEKAGLLSPRINFVDGYKKIDSEMIRSSYFIINLMQGPTSFYSQAKAYDTAFKNFIEVTSKTKENYIIHLSCLGANSLLRNSPYLKEKGRQEDTIKLRVANHTIVRTGVLFGKEDLIFNDLANNFGKVRQLYMPSESKKRYWQLCYIGDLILALSKIINQPEIYTSSVYELHSDETFNVTNLIKRVSDYTGYSNCSLLPLSDSLLKIARKLPFIATYTSDNPNYQMMLKSSFVSSNDSKTRVFQDLSIKPTQTKEVMPRYLFRN